MRLTVVLIILSTFLLKAKSYSQYVSYIGNNVSLENVLKEFSHQTGYYLFYKYNEVKDFQIADIKTNNVSLQQAMQILLKDLPFAFNLKENTIVITKIQQSEKIKTQELLPVQKPLSGLVRDETGNVIPGATILVKGTSVGTTTNVEGKFEIVAKDGQTLVVTLLGYISQEIIVRNQQKIIVELKEGTTGLDEIVVVGYGTQKKAHLTGAVSHISSEVLENRPSPSLGRLLQGTMPNLNLVMADGSPKRGATFNVRGTTSIGAGGSALVLIDGVEGDPDLLNPNDIASVTVLKDAASSAVYGSRAAFGVVLITTKNPTNDVIRVNYNSNYSINSRVTKPKTITNGYQWAKNFNEAFSANYDYAQLPTVVNNIFPFSQDYLDRLRIHDEDPTLPKVEYNEALGRYEYFANTDWFDVIHNNQIPSTEQSLSLSGGSEKVNFYLSGRYYYQDGIFNHNPDQFHKYNVRGKGSLKAKSWLTLHNNFEFSNQQYHFPMLADRENQTIWRMMDLMSYPMATVYNPDGTLTHIAAYGGTGAFIDGNNYSNSENSYMRNTAGFTSKMWKDRITFKGDLTYSRTRNDEDRIHNYVNYSNAPGETGRFGNSLLKKNTSDRKYLSSNLTLDYAQVFNGRHDVKALIGYNVEESSTSNFNGSRDGFILPNKPDFNLMDGLNYTLAGGLNEWSYLGAFYRFNYIYDGRYLLEVNGRYDGSSKFPDNQRFGFFPSVSAGWILTNESFFAPFKSVLNEFKVRTSYGSLGNGNVNAYRYLEQMAVQKSNNIQGSILPNYTEMPIVIPEGLTWEKSTTFNIGVDFGFFNNNLTGSFDWYNRQTQDMFTASEPLPAVFGATVPFGNYSDLSTKGWELVLAYKSKFDLFEHPFSYGLSGSLWDNYSKITRYNNTTGSLAGSYYTGHTIGEIWGYTTLGLFQSQEEIKAHADQSFLRNSVGRVYLPGDLKFADLNGDGKINQGDNTLANPGDRSIIGNSSPRYQFGFTLSGRYKNFGIQAFFQGIGKRDWYFEPDAGAFWGLYSRPYGFQPAKMMENRWSEDNPDAYYPRLRTYLANGTSGTMGVPQTRYLQDVSYLRMKNLTIDYAFPDKLLAKLGIVQASIFVTAQNLFTLSGLFKYSEGIDPEVIENSKGDLLNDGPQAYAYPMLKSTTFGINVSF